jgi:SAM-dependent methyltransferase
MDIRRGAAARPVYTDPAFQSREDPRVGAEAVRRFDAMADQYDAMEPWYEHLYARLHALLRRHLAPPAGALPGRALDAGCGTGFQTALLAELGYVAHGVDVAPRLLAVARDRLGGVALARASVEALPYAAATFDAVACCGSTLSFVDTPGRALAEIGRVLRPGGRLLLECEHAWSLDLGWALLGALTRDTLGYGLRPGQAWRLLMRRPGSGCVVRYPGYGMLRLFTLPELRAMLRDAGLVAERTWGIHMATNLIPSTVLHRPRLPGPLAALYRALARVDDALRLVPGTPWIANSVVVLARKRSGGRRPPALGVKSAMLGPGSTR